MKLPDKALAETSDPVAKPFWDRVISMTPVVMTVVATILAGLSSSEMSIAQYHRALSAQNQSKAGDQWSFYQAKKLREATMASSLDLLQGLGTSTALTVASLESSIDRLSREQTNAATTAPTGAGAPDSQPAPATAPAVSSSPKSDRLRQLMRDPKIQDALSMIIEGRLPKVEDKPVNTPEIQAVLDAADRGESEEDSAPLTRKITEPMLLDAFATARANAKAFDAVSTPITKAGEKISAALSAQAAAARAAQREAEPGTDSAKTAVVWRTDADQLNADFTAAKLHWQSLRYAADARYNMASAQLYEVQVRRSSTASERHRDRSKDFFYGMLAAQAAVTIATFSLALKQRSLLWSLATLAGLAAIGLGIYVYLFT